MRKIQVQGFHHITIVGADRQTSIDFWEGVLGMPLVFEQPNSTDAAQSHLFFDPGDGRLVTVLTHEARSRDGRRTSTETGAVHHLAFRVSIATLYQASARLTDRGITYSGPKNRGFMMSLYVQDPLGLLIELASYTFEPPTGFTHTDVLLEAHRIRIARSEATVTGAHLADAIERLVARIRASLSPERGPRNPY
ncbi:MAG: VOC family protein [Pseudomonadota bacterium]